MRRVRTSTWILTAVFLITLTTYLLIKPAPAATVGVTTSPSSPVPTTSLSSASPAQAPTPSPSATTPRPTGKAKPATTPKPATGTGPAGSASPAGTPSASAPVPADSPSLVAGGWMLNVEGHPPGGGCGALSVAHQISVNRSTGNSWSGNSVCDLPHM